jgi:hypothetical protein
MRRTSLFSLDDGHRIVEFKIDEALDRVSARDNHPHGRPDTEPLLATFGEPRLTIGLHDVLVIVERIEAQQAVDTQAPQLDEATVLDHRRDKPIEGLPLTLA